jgi:hypothetical protein
MEEPIAVEVTVTLAADGSTGIRMSDTDRPSDALRAAASGSSGLLRASSGRPNRSSVRRAALPRLASVPLRLAPGSFSRVGTGSWQRHRSRRPDGCPCDSPGGVAILVRCTETGSPRCGWRVAEADVATGVIALGGRTGLFRTPGSSPLRRPLGHRSSCSPCWGSSPGSPSCSLSPCRSPAQSFTSTSHDLRLVSPSGTWNRRGRNVRGAGPAPAIATGRPHRRHPGHLDAADGSVRSRGGLHGVRGGDHKARRLALGRGFSEVLRPMPDPGRRPRAPGPVRVAA